MTVFLSSSTIILLLILFVEYLLARPFTHFSHMPLDYLSNYNFHFQKTVAAIIPLHFYFSIVLCLATHKHIFILFLA